MKALNNKKLILGILISATLLRVLFLILKNYYFNLDYTEDELNYAIGGQHLIDHWLHNKNIDFFEFKSIDKGFYYLNSILEIIVGNNITALQTISIFSWTLGSYILFKLVKLIFSNREALLTLAGCSYAPFLIYTSTLNTKESVLYLILNSTLFFLALLLKKYFQPLYLVGLISCLACLLFFRLYMGLIIITICYITFFIYVIYNPINKKYLYITALILIALFSAIPIHEYLIFRIGDKIILSTLCQSVNTALQSSCTGKHILYANVDIKTLGAFLSFLPKSLMMFFAAPLPYIFSKPLSMFEKLILIEVIPLLILSLYISKGVYLSLKEQNFNGKLLILTIALFTTIFTIIFSTINCNLGTLYRHKSSLYPFYFMFIAYGIRKKHHTLNKNHST